MNALKLFLGRLSFAGDAMDLGALGLAFARSNRKPAVAGAIGFVAGATLLDVFAARGLDRETGQTFPAAEHPEAA